MKRVCSLVFVILGVGCDDQPSPVEPGGGGASVESSSSTGTGMGGMGGAGGAGGGAAADVPANAVDIFPFLQSKGYASFAAESQVHPGGGTSPHGMVRTFVNPTLFASLEAGMAEHPQGSAAIKELYAADGTTLKGWAAMVKTDPTSNGGQGWYWYEIFDIVDGSNPPYSGNGLGICTGCHSAGKDYFTTPFPLQ